MRESQMQVTIRATLQDLSDSMKELTDSFRAISGYPPADKGLGYWQRREARWVAERSLRARLRRIVQAVDGLLFEVGRRAVNVGRSLRGDVPEWQ